MEALSPRHTMQLPDGVTCDLVVYLTTTDDAARLDTSFTLFNLSAVPMMDIPEVAQRVLAFALRQMSELVTREFRLMTAAEVVAYLKEHQHAAEQPADVPA